MALHNGESFLQEQLGSILPQLGPDDELVVSDDGSTDNTLEILKSQSDQRISLLPARKFGSPAKNFEYALANCRNEIIFLADQDDIWHDDKVKIMKEELAYCELVVCDCRLVDQKRNVAAPSFFEWNKSQKGLIKNLLRNSFVGCCMAFHRKVLNKVLPFPYGIPMHDQWIGLIAQRYF